jgi:hypothetical protein
LVFSALMGSSIVAAMVLMMTTRTEGALPATTMVSVVVVVSLAAVLAYLRPVSHGASPSTASPDAGDQRLLVGR